MSEKLVYDSPEKLQSAARDAEVGVVVSDVFTVGFGGAFIWKSFEFADKFIASAETTDNYTLATLAVLGGVTLLGGLFASKESHRAAALKTVQAQHELATAPETPISE